MSSAWTLETTPTGVAHHWSGLCWAETLGLFVAGGSANPQKIMTSPDGIIWTAQSIAVANLDLRGIAWSPDLGTLCAVSGSATNSNVFLSTNATAWTLQANTPRRGYRSVCWGGSGSKVFVAVGKSGTACVCSSPTGTTWTEHASPDLTSSWVSVTWAGALGLFVAVADFGDIRIMTSPDGAVWTGQMGFEVAVQKNWTSVCANAAGNLLVAVGQVNTSTAYSMVSADAINWTVHDAIIPTPPVVTGTGWQSVIYSTTFSCFVAVSDANASNSIHVGDATRQVMTSLDGQSWVASPAAFSTGGWPNGAKLWQALAESPSLHQLAAVAEANNAQEIQQAMAGVVQLVSPVWCFDGTTYQAYAPGSAPCVAPGLVPPPTLAQTVAALEAQPCPGFFPTYIIRLLDRTLYESIVSTYGFGTPIIFGLAPDDAVNLTGAPLNLNPSAAAQSVWPQVFVDPAALSVLGVTISTADGGGTVAVSYATPFGRPCTSALWKWQALVLWRAVADVLTVAPAYTTDVVPPGNFSPSGALSNGVGFGTGALGPCGCPPT